MTTAVPASLSRRNWLRSLATTAVAALTVRTGHSKSNPQPAEVELLDCAVAGFQFHHGEQLWTQLGVGERVQLQREPDNPHDALAIAVHYRGQQIGYIPRLANRALARRLDEGLPTVATISTLHQRSDPWQRVSIRWWGWYSREHPYSPCRCLTRCRTVAGARTAAAGRLGLDRAKRAIFLAKVRNSGSRCTLPKPADTGSTTHRRRY